MGLSAWVNNRGASRLHHVRHAVTLTPIGPTVAHPIRRVSSSLHKCSAGAAEVEKEQSKLENLMGVDQRAVDGVRAAIEGG